MNFCILVIILGMIGIKLSPKKPYLEFLINDTSWGHSLSEVFLAKWNLEKTYVTKLKFSSDKSQMKHIPTYITSRYYPLFLIMLKWLVVLLLKFLNHKIQSTIVVNNRNSKCTQYWFVVAFEVLLLEMPIALNIDFYLLPNI